MRMLGLLGLAALFSVDAQAQDRGSERGQPANQANGQEQAWDLLAGKYDKDKDGKISLEEYPRGETKFKSFDRDGDGAITAKDFESGGGRQNRGNRQRGNRAQRMQGMAIGMLIVPADSDKDGSVSAKEWKVHLAGLTTEDGGVDLAKLGKNMPQMGRRGNRNQGGRQGQDPERMAQMRTRMVVRMFDTDRDGEVVMAAAEESVEKIETTVVRVLGEMGAEVPFAEGGRGVVCLLEPLGDGHHPVRQPEVGVLGVEGDVGFVAEAVLVAAG